MKLVSVTCVDFCEQRIPARAKWFLNVLSLTGFKVFSLLSLPLHFWTCNFYLHCLAFPWKIGSLRYQNISQDYSDYIKTFGGNQVWQESWPDCIVSSQPFQLWQCQVGELPCSSSQTFQAVLILWIFPLGDLVLQVLLSKVTQFGCWAKSRADNCLMELTLPYGGEWLLGWRDVVPTTHFLLQHVQQAVFQ